jgi:murein L,D-transpeptidase YcbB/YkuD
MEWCMLAAGVLFVLCAILATVSHARGCKDQRTAPGVAERLAESSSLAAADRRSRCARTCRWPPAADLDAATGLSPAAEAAVAEIRRADDWGLDAAAFQLPALPAASGSELSRTGRADAEIALSLAVLKYARHARGGRAEPTSLSRNLDRKLPLLDPGQVIDQASKATSPDAYLQSLHPQHPQFEALRQKYLASRSGQPVARPDPTPSADGKQGGKKQARPRRPTRAGSSSTWRSGAGCRSRSATSSSGSTSPSTPCASSRTAR